VSEVPAPEQLAVVVSDAGAASDRCPQAPVAMGEVLSLHQCLEEVE
jgi:hypothetical protein